MLRFSNMTVEEIKQAATAKKLVRKKLTENFYFYHAKW